METFGQKLRLERAERGLSLEQLAGNARIPIDHLRALERDDRRGLPAATIVRGYLGAVADCLEVDRDLMIEDYVLERPGPAPTQTEEPRTSLSAVLSACALVVVLAGVGAWWFGARDAAEPARQLPSKSATAAEVPITPSPEATPVVRSEPAEAPLELAAPSPEPPVQDDVAAEPDRTALNIPEHGVGTAVADRQLVGESDRFREGERVWFWTRVSGGVSGETIDHVWMREGVESARVSLTLGGPQWRTHSAKKLWPGSAGSWTVEARDENGEVLASRRFVCVP